MKTSTLFISILSAADIVAAEKFVAGPPGWAQSLGLNATEPEHRPQLIARQAKGSGRTVILKNRTPQIRGSKSVKIRYGPFTVRGGGAYVLRLQISYIALISHSFSTSFLGSQLLQQLSKANVCL
jgi:hypothetical protein